MLEKRDALVRISSSSIMPVACRQEQRVWREKEASKAAKEVKGPKGELSSADKKDDSSKKADAGEGAPHSNGNVDGPDSNGK